MLHQLRKNLAEIPRGLRTRFAPSPSGYLHLGHVASAIYVWGIAQIVEAEVLLRIEDHDRQRSQETFRAAICEDLAWLGLRAADTPYALQSEHPERYDAALATLAQSTEIYACSCSRAAISARMSGRDKGELVYDGHCRHAQVPAEKQGLRVHLPPRSYRFDDLRLGPQEQQPSAQCGDLLLRERNGSWTYNFCVSVDDAVENIGLVIRGVDLLSATGRQLQLAELLGRTQPPYFLHHPLIVDEQGEKLSKRFGATGLRQCREAGRRPEDVLGQVAASLGLWEEGKALAAHELGRLFS